jgi:subtilisin family serine protease
VTAFQDATGRGIRIAAVDSGVHRDHPHVNFDQGIAGGIAIDPEGGAHPDFLDRLGHGTAVAAAIRDQAPGADVFAVKVFDRVLSARIGQLVAAIEWAARERMDIVNLSLGTAKREHEPALRGALDAAARAGTIVVAARDDEGVLYLPGSLSGVLPVQVDWTLDRRQFRIAHVDGVAVVRASGLPREIPGVPPARNLQGVSFAVANATGFAARAMEGMKEKRSVAAVVARLRDVLA